MRDLRNAFEIAEDRFVAVDVRLGYFPVIDAGVARLAAVGKHGPAVEIIQVDLDRPSANAGHRQFNRTDAAIHRRVIVLTAGRHAYDLRFDVLSDLANLFDVMSRSCELVERAR